MDIIAFSFYFIPATVFLLMVCVGMELTTPDFARVVRYPKPVVTGVIGQLVLMPAAAFAIAAFFADDMTTKVGLILLAACPGGPLSNSFVYLAGAKTDLSVSLTAVNGFLALITTPLIAGLGVAVFASQDAGIELPVLKTILQIFSLAILPVVIGMFIRAKKAAWVERNNRSIKVFAMFCMVSHILLVLVLNADRILEGFQKMMPISLLFCLVSCFIGHFIARIARLDRDTQLTIGIEVGLQNVVLAILIANILLERPEFSLFSVTYAASFIFIIFPWIYLHRNPQWISGLFKKKPRTDQS